MKIVLITGGQACGKSTYAQKLAEMEKKPRVYIATARPYDEEIKEKIRKHVEMRKNNFITIEESVDLSSALLKEKAEVVLIDCLTMWTSNILLDNENNYEEIIEKELLKLKDTLKKISKKTKKVIFVTNEVGWGIIPSNKLSRIYVNLLGRVNKFIASISDEVYMMMSGIEVKIK
ncbi:adenosylcobinamide kinase/adenosylcobinamide phosphate guanyltransferase [Tepiditoga spiralis]|uniref:Adenosylcobinamide kinase n=1 Tax=Tepiditoga spiralis TaxID=2108365 RepID=A0A7G1G6B9_9BACT|nr:bifunctional adenosylcobinamide kinase/adenosylcobinamide-phosphate guanylyltransferase [Tepiditoga spiralis]BBE31981.1 adenosylcobinamide kinase/adenosylcobinamide phosphate guanyltransferase [Tepiditoga spiralis]